MAMHPQPVKGLWGSILITDTDTTHNGPFNCLKMIDACSFTTLTSGSTTITGDTGDTIATFTFPAQYELWGAFSAVRAKVGRLEAYYSQEKP